MDSNVIIAIIGTAAVLSMAMMTLESIFLYFVI